MTPEELDEFVRTTRMPTIDKASTLALIAREMRRLWAIEAVMRRWLAAERGVTESGHRFGSPDSHAFACGEAKRELLGLLDAKETG